MILDTLRDTPASAGNDGPSHLIPDGRRGDDNPTFLEELVEDLIWVEGGPEQLRGPGNV